MIFKRKKKQIKIPRNCFELPLKHRFTFVAEGWNYYEGYTVQLSENVGTRKRAFFIASQLFSREYADKANGSVSVFYGDVEAPDCKDVLYGAYNSFNKGLRK